MEIWKDIEGFEGIYKINTFGEVYSFIYNKKLKPYDSKSRFHKGYLKVRLYKNGKHYECTIHRLVACMFIENPENKPDVNHKDGNKLNNYVENLEWCTKSENIIHAFKTNLKDFSNGKAPSCKLNIEQVKEIKNMYKTNSFSQSHIAKSFNISPQLVNMIIKNKIWINVI